MSTIASAFYFINYAEREEQARSIYSLMKIHSGPAIIPPAVQVPIKDFGDINIKVGIPGGTYSNYWRDINIGEATSHVSYTAVVCTSVYVIVAGAIAYFLIKMNKRERSN